MVPLRFVGILIRRHIGFVEFASFWFEFKTISLSKRNKKNMLTWTSDIQYICVLVCLLLSGLKRKKFYKPLLFKKRFFSLVKQWGCFKNKNPSYISVESGFLTLGTDSRNSYYTDPLGANIEQPSFRGIYSESWHASC